MWCHAVLAGALHLDSRVDADATDILQRINRHATIVDMAILDGYNDIL